jgi:hypothetical protein
MAQEADVEDNIKPTETQNSIGRIRYGSAWRKTYLRF